MLTIDEIKNVSFRKATLSGGYRAEDVDEFIDEVIASFEQLKKEKTNLVHKIDRNCKKRSAYFAEDERRLHQRGKGKGRQDHPRRRGEGSSAFC